MAAEVPLTFRCGRDDLVGILHKGNGRLPLFVFVVGGPQYRVGSHRMFVKLARELVSHGADVFRFDCRGMGDSSGSFNSFENIGDDIQQAINCAMEHSDTTGVVLLGLCDGASACAMYSDPGDRVRAMVLINPWVRTEQSEAKSTMTHYYRRRILQRDFWLGALRGDVNVLQALASFTQRAVALLKPADQTVPYVERMLKGISRFQGRILVVMSERDLTAQEFADLHRSSGEWQIALQKSQSTLLTIDGADHTFSESNGVADLAGRVADFFSESPASDAP